MATKTVKSSSSARVKVAKANGKNKNLKDNTSIPMKNRSRFPRAATFAGRTAEAKTTLVDRRKKPLFLVCYIIQRMLLLRGDGHNDPMGQTH